MKLQGLYLSKFSAFRDASFDFSPGVNVFIGANGTGKSHLLKLLYSTLRANRDAAGKAGAHGSFGTLLAQKLAGVFRPDEGAIGRLVSRAVGKSKATVCLETDEGDINFRVTTMGNLHVTTNRVPWNEQSVFIPSREALAMYEGFVQAYEERELSFDETYRDLCVALSGTQLRGPRLQAVHKLAAPLQEILGGRIVLEGGRFYMAGAHGQGTFEAHLLSEGWRKIGSLLHLIVNGSLIRNGFLFWDEPEANLNPRLVTKVVRTLQQLAAFGVQVFVSTHDYLLSNELSLVAEYKDQQPRELRCDLRFFAFNRISSGAVEVEAGATLPQVKHNDILEEFAAHYDRENALLDQSVPKKKELPAAT